MPRNTIVTAGSSEVLVQNVEGYTEQVEAP
jgi:hypothetical protein